jgi:hypothetical protein
LAWPCRGDGPPAVITFGEISPEFSDNRIVGFSYGFDFLLCKRFIAEARLALLIIVGRALGFHGLVQNIAFR